jgi:NTE family protein
MADENLRVFVALEGGGAKGLVHIGALKALEERAVTFCGLAGTSAGAIVAALKATGYSADELVDPVNKTTLLPQIDPLYQNATDFFGPNAWSKINLFRNAGQLGGGRLGAVVMACAIVLLGSIGLAAHFFGALGAIVVVLGWAWAAGAFFNFVMQGLASVKTFRDKLDDVLSRKMFPGEAKLGEEKNIVKFKHFDGVTKPSLKIVATNLSKGELQLFSPELTPDVAVADAVAASVCLPIIFEAWIIEKMLHFDGGLVSNLPAWTFDDERALDPDATTIAIEILAAPTNASPPTARRWLIPAIRTAVFGSSVLNKRGVGRFEALQLKTELELLAFDADREKVFQAVTGATAAARIAIVQRLFVVPQIYRDACAAVRDLVREVLSQSPALLGGQPFQGRLRVARAAPTGEHSKSLRLDYGVGFDTDADTDEELQFPIANTHVGMAYSDNETAFAYFREPGVAGPAAGENPPYVGLDRQRKRLVRRDMAWLLCVPVITDKAKVPAKAGFVVTVDCDQPIDPEAESLQAAIDLFKTQIETIFNSAMTNLKGGN